MENESLSAQIVKLQIINTKFKARIAELEARLKEAEEKRDEYAFNAALYKKDLGEARADAGRLRGALESIVTVVTAMGTVDDFGNFLILKNAEANFDLHETLEGLRSVARNALARQAALSPAEQADDEKGAKG